jgi:putative endonuclease
VYIVECADGTLYTGIARDVARRIDDHNGGRGARYTRGRRPVRLLRQGPPMSRGDALRLELRIKRLRGADKLELLSRAHDPAAIAPADSA